MKQITISTSGSTRIGRQGENEACEILFPVAGWQELYGVGEFTGFHQRPNDCTAYPVNVTVENEVVHWVVTASDLEFSGYGEFQLVYTVNGVVAKSVIYKTTIGRSLGITKAVPAPFIPWFNRIIDLLGVGMTAHATTLPSGAEATASYDDSTRVLSLGIPKGKDGKDGEDGKDYVITPADYEAIAEKTAELVPPYDDTEIKAEVADVKQDLTDLSALVDGKMEFYKVTLDGYPMKFYHDGVAQNYADLEAKYNDDKYFLYCEYESVTFIPSLPPVEDPVHPEKVLEFVATWKYSGAMHITSIKINELEQIKVEEFEAVGDVKINGQSVVVDGVAEIPVASASEYGVAKTYSVYGTVIRQGTIATSMASDNDINERSSQFKVIVPNNLDYAVKAAMTDGKGAAWTDAEKASARDRITSNYRLLTEFTCDGSTASLLINKDSDGSDLSISDIILCIETNVVDAITATNNIYFRNANNSIVGYAYATTNSNTTSQKRMNVFSFIDGNVRRCFSTAYINSNSTGNVLDPYAYNSGRDLVFGDKDTLKIAKIEISQRLSSLPVGTKIYVYVR